MTGDAFGYTAPAHDQCIPLPLDGDVDVEVAALVSGMIGHSASPEFINSTIAWVAGATRLAREDADQARDVVLQTTFGAWLLLPEPRLLRPGPVAFLRAGPLGPDANGDEALAAVFDLSAELFGQLEVEDLDTASGNAVCVRRRPVLVMDGERQVHEHRLVLWPRPEEEVVVFLSLYTIDLVAGGRAAQPFRELAASVSWAIT